MKKTITQSPIDYGFKPLTNCMSTKAWLSYLKFKGHTTKNILSGIHYSEDFLMDDNNWIATEHCYKLAANIALSLPDEKGLFRTIAFWAVKQKLTKSLWAIAGSTVLPFNLYDSLSKNIVRFNRHRKCEIEHIDKCKAVIRLKHMTHIPAQREICQWTGGLIEAAPLTIGYPPAKVIKQSCECHGEEYCVYMVEWQNTVNILTRIKNLTYHRRDILKLQSEALEESLDKLLERYEKLLDSEKRHRTLVETIKDIVYTMDLQGRFTYISPNIEKITGFAPKELIGNHFVSILAPEDREKTQHDFAENLKKQNTVTLEIKIVTRHGRAIPMEINTTMLYGAHREPVGRIGVARDITRRFKEEARRKEMEVRALTQDKLASLGEIATGVAHEINQPLTYIKIILQTTLSDLSHGELSPEGIKEDFQESLRQVERIAKIISHLRTFGRSDVTAFGPVSLTAVIHDTLILMRERLRVNNIDLQMEISDSFPMVYGNHVKLEQVFINLIQNSMDALLERGSGEIVLRAREEDDSALIFFSDSGPGVEPIYREKIFEPFFTTKEAGKGTGIGLSIVYGIIQEHNGDITCSSGTGNGAAFTIRLPIYMDQGCCSRSVRLDA